MPSLRFIMSILTIPLLRVFFSRGEGWFFESEQILVSNSVFVKNLPRFLEVFVPWVILFKGYNNNLFVILFTCSIAFQRYQTWYGNNYLNLINSQAGPKKKIKYTSRDVARRRTTLCLDLWLETKNNNKKQQQFHEINGFLSLQLRLSFELGFRLRLTNY